MMEFDSKIIKRSILYFIWVPIELSNSFKKKGHIPVKGTINGESFMSTLAPRKNGRHILYLNTNIRKQVTVKEGEFVNVQIEYDPSSREMPIPEDLEFIMNENRDVWNRFLSMTTAHRNELLKFLASAKREETRLKRINKIIHHTIHWKSGQTFFEKSS